MLMQVTLRKHPRQALVIPETALMPTGREQHVLVLQSEGEGYKVERRQITIGSRRPGQVEVLDGLDEGELVITQGTLRVRPGQTVTLRALDDGSKSLAELLRQPAPGSSGQ
jgi:membrane fusion protein (multidrug efflux system)